VKLLDRNAWQQQLNNNAHAITLPVWQFNNSKIQSAILKGASCEQVNPAAPAEGQLQQHKWKHQLRAHTHGCTCDMKPPL
jgi:hypothetical protein